MAKKGPVVGECEYNCYDIDSSVSSVCESVSRESSWFVVVSAGPHTHRELGLGTGIQPPTHPTCPVRPTCTNVPVSNFVGFVV